MTLAHTVQGSGPLLVLLHPVGLDRNCWDELPAFLARRYTVAALDLPGHGESPDRPAYTRMSEYADDVIQWLTGLQRGNAILVGSSFGGMIAQEIACTRPDLVSRLVLCASPGLMSGKLSDVCLARGRTAREGGMETLLASTLERWFTTDFLKSPAVASVRDRLLHDRPDNWSAAWSAIAHHDAQYRLGKCKAPALIIAGGLDTGTPLSMKMDLARSLPNSRMVVLPNAPHIMQLECPVEFKRVFDDYLMHDWWMQRA